ncbi:MAG TPA: PDZ domain-containing protein [Phycisphaerales bacterium]|nr:PDZ domain-containing protein [Phycisphaerales bacterium]
MLRRISQLLAILLTLPAFSQQPSTYAPLTTAAGIPALELTWNNTDYYVVFDTGSEINAAPTRLGNDPTADFPVLGIPISVRDFRTLPTIPTFDRPIVILGRPFFNDHIVQLDFGKSQVAILTPDQFASQRDESLLGSPIAVTDGRVAIVSACITANNRTVGASRVLIDTGSADAVTIAPALRARLDLAATQGIERTLQTIRGDRKQLLTNIRAQLTLGNATLNAPVAWPIESNLDDDITIGTDALVNSRLTIDLANNVIYVAPSPRAAQPATWGFSIKPQTLSPLTIILSTIYPDSPAATAGLQSGDKLTAIDNQPVAEMTPTHFRNLLSNPDTKSFSLTLQRNTETLTITLTRP